MLKNLIMEALRQLLGPSIERFPVKVEQTEEPIDVEAKPSTSTILQFITYMINTKGVEEV